MIRIPLAKIRALARHRPPGYEDDCIEHGALTEDAIEFTDEHYAALLAKYRPKQFIRLGDAVAFVTNLAGIKPCGGCKERQEKLNHLIQI